MDSKTAWGSSITTVGGRRFDFAGPAQETITPSAIGHALAHTCRYGGHCRIYYSVAQHSWLASYIVPAAFAFEALMHDAAEAFIGDIPSPLKRLLPDFKIIEARVERAIAQRFNLPLEMSPEVRAADRVLLATEMRDLMPPDARGGEGFTAAEFLPLPIIPMDPGASFEHWRSRFTELWGTWF